MTLHLVKLAVGIRDLAHLAEVQRRRLEEARRVDPGASLWHRTRQRPRRAEALLDGGSIYWVIRGAIRARQRLLGFESVRDEEGRPCCRLLLDPVLVATVAKPCRAFQGWRYLSPEGAPPDRETEGSTGDLPPEMAAELRALGLL